MTKEGLKLEARSDQVSTHIFFKVRISSLIRHFAGCLFLATSIAHAATITPTVSGPIGDPQKAGQELAQKLMLMAPEENSSASGVLKIQDREGKMREIPVSCQISIRSNLLSHTGQKVAVWEVTYVVGGDRAEKLTIVHAPNQPNEYLYSKPGATQPQKLTGAQAMIPFAGSDFWLADLGLEFLHWPKQRLLKTEMRKGRWCNVLQSDNPSKSPAGYARVISWLDKESGGPILAEGENAAGKRIKQFSIRSLKKVEGVWQLEEMQITSEETKSRTRLEFDLDKPRPNPPR